MGYWQRRRLHKESAVDANTSWRYPLPSVGLYSAFSVAIEADRYAARASAAAQEMLHEVISKIEILSEGTKVIKSLRGPEVKALNLFDFRRQVPIQHREAANGVNLDTLYLLAGRSLRDKEYMFDMARIAAPELVITNALTEDTAEYWASDTLDYTIYGWRWVGDPLPFPKGYFRADERIYYSTSALNAEKPIQITTGKRIRRILLKGWTTRTSLGGHVNKVELKVDEGEYSVAVHDSMMEWALQNSVEYGLDPSFYVAVYMFEKDTTHQIDVNLPYHSTALAAIAENKGQHDVSATIGSGTLDTVIKHDGGGAITVQEVEVWVDGHGYQRAGLFGFDLEDDLSDMLDTRQMGKLVLMLTEQAASKVISVVVEEEVLY